MSDVLARICARKREEVARRQQERPLAAIEAAARQAGPPRGFAATLEESDRAGRLALIAEIKKASPSRGVIRTDFDPATLARAYAAGGASCLSVLTDEPFFQGRDEDLVIARAATALPVLRKDFTIDPWQVVEARALGADAILVILAAVDDVLARELCAAATEWGMDALVEVHDLRELERALRLDCRLIGINNRDLRTLEVSLSTTIDLAPRVPPDRLVVAESGLFTHLHLLQMRAAGARAFLVGESLMRQSDVAAATRRLLGLERVP
ncbi:Indole-3-glycerol phosphate synthase [bacterium HR40]|nr:Indole-3-glycerol phosphate synthase [bacterium HR40]